jgi:peroxiredoxin
MKGTYKLIIGSILVFSLFGLFGCPSTESNQKEEKLDTKKQSVEVKAPDFVLEDLKGNQVMLSDYKGKTVLLVFTATWCPYCRAEIPHLKEIYSKYNAKGLEIIYIDIQESVEKVSSFMAKHNIPFKTLLDKDGKVAYLFGVRGVPTKFLIGKDGTILCKACRSVDAMLDKLFGA